MRHGQKKKNRSSAFWNKKFPFRDHSPGTVQSKFGQTSATVCEEVTNVAEELRH